MSCDARIRPFTDNTEIRCGLPTHLPSIAHEGDLRDYAYPGSVTTVKWIEGDRRSFDGEWPGACPDCRVQIPLGHPGSHV